MTNNKFTRNIRGFTLLEILIALFIFTLVSMMLMNGLRNVIETLTTTEAKAERLRQLQFSLLVMSRDIEQIVNRPIINASGKKEEAFSGSSHEFSFTHTGFASSTTLTSTLQRSAYQWRDRKLERLSWSSLDQPPQSQARVRVLLSQVKQAHFEYIDEKGHSYPEWRQGGEGGQALPRAIRVYLTFAQWGTMTQLFLIPVQDSATQQNAKPEGDASAQNNPPEPKK